VRLSAELFRRVLDAAPRENHRVSLFAAHFDGTIFEGEAGFGEAIFRGDAVFEGATFEGDAVFSGATFEAWVGFAGATFRRKAEFVATTFDGGTQFEEATFQGEAVLARATFQGEAVLARATFQGEVWFKEAIFRSEVWFDEVTFRSEVWFSGATFEAGIRFEEAIFQSEAGFGGAIFEGEAWFYQAIFQNRIRFDGATFRRGAWFDGATFEVEAGFIQVTFRGGVGFGGVIFQEQASFEEATFERARQVGPLLANQLVLDEAVFYERVQLDVAATALYARRGQFRDGVQFRLRWASVVLDDANLAAPAILAGVPPFPGLDEQAAVSQWEQLPPGPRDQRWRPRLLSLCRADVAGLRVANVDLRPCRFIGAHNLDKFRIEGAPLLPALAAGGGRAARPSLKNSTGGPTALAAGDSGTGTLRPASRRPPPTSRQP
jgi:uncharacterized protein YjbI with pentapeptide repeats